MSLFRAKEKSPFYHAANNGGEWAINQSSTQDLQKWASDPSCIEKDECAAVLAKRIAEEEAQRLEREARNAAKRAQLADDPFDSRTEISADARHVAGRIVTHLWIIFVIMPFVLGILYEILK